MLRSAKTLALSLAAALLAHAVATPTADAQIAREFTYQGVLEQNGNPVTGPVPMFFNLYDAASGGSAIATYPPFPLPPAIVPVNEGDFSIKLPFTTPGNLFNGRRLFLEVSVLSTGGTTVLPRQEITPAPFALATPALRNNQSSVRRGEGFGEVRLGDGTTASNIQIGMGSLLIPNGGICLDTDGSCVAPAGGIRVGLGGIVGADSSDQHLLLVPDGTGNVGIGVASPTEKLDIGGAIRIRGADIVEGFDSSTGKAIEPGTVVSIDPVQAGRLMPSGQAYDTKVAGVVSGARGVPYGMSLAYDGQFDGETKVAMTGRVYVKCSVEAGAIQPGDLLTTASVPGHAMKAAQRDRAHGAVIGKAMSALDEGTGLVLVLVNLQ